MSRSKEDFGLGVIESPNPSGKAEELRRDSIALARQLLAVSAGKDRATVLIAVGVLLGQIERKTAPFPRTDMFDLIARAMDDQHTAHH